MDRHPPLEVHLTRLNRERPVKVWLTEDSIVINVERAKPLELAERLARLMESSKRYPGMTNIGGDVPNY